MVIPYRHLVNTSERDNHYNEGKQSYWESNPCYRRERHITDIPSVQFYNALTAKPSLKTVCKLCAKHSITF